jgi:uncharacterized protein YndB with AHSA1/START domain
MSEESSNWSNQSIKDDSKTVVIERIFDAPRDLVFEAWTKPEHLLLWFAPRGCTIHFSRIDIRPGGDFHSCIRHPSFGDCWCIGVYEEIVQAERIAQTLAIADEQGRKVDPVHVGHDPRWPRETRVIVTFDDYNGQTRLRLRQNVLESLAKQTGAYPGWVEMLDRLDELMSRRVDTVA